MTSDPLFIIPDFFFIFQTNVAIAVLPTQFGSSVNPITTRGADYAHHITASSPGFENPAASLSSKHWRFKFELEFFKKSAAV